MNLTDNEQARFWRKVDRESTPEGCWPWKGKGNAEGRGRMTFRGTIDYAYRWSVLITRGEIPEGSVVRHQCPGGGNPSCCRPDHLSVEGGQRENNRDTAEQGRHRSAVLDMARARRIRERYAATDRPLQRELAQEYGVTPSAISEVVRGKSWPRAGGPITQPRSSSVGQDEGAGLLAEPGPS